jgi:uncharacterized protein
MHPAAAVVDGEQLLDWWQIISHRPYRDIDLALGQEDPTWRAWLKNAENPEYWTRLSAFHSYDKIDIPVLHITGWYDGSAAGALFTFEQMREASHAAENQFLVVGPWDHAGTRHPQQTLGGIDFGPAALANIRAIHLRWFDHWLKGTPNGQDSEPRVSFFTMGRNTWRSDTWPPAAVQERSYYFDRGESPTDAGALVDHVPAQEGGDDYIYDPNDPTPSTEDSSAFLISDASLAHGYVENRSDVLTYTTAPLEEAVEITGTPVVTLHAASTAVDTDYAVSLCFVDNNGDSWLIAEGLVRAMYRNGDGSRSAVTPQEVHAYRIALSPTSIEIPVGHQIRICVASAAFPAYDRNPNTGAALGEDLRTEPASQRIYRGGSHASNLALPIVTPAN